MSLSNTKNGQNVSVVRIHLDIDRQKRLLAMGLVPGTTLKMLDNSLFGASLVLCRGNKLVIGKELADQIVVRS